MIEATTAQVSLAQSLGISDSDNLDSEELIQAIENALGQNTMHEQARWYLMSVLRHGRKQDWESLADCGVGDAQQNELVELYIGSDAAKQALRSVMKDAHCRFTLLRFAKARRVEQRVLSTTTKAFKAAQVLLRDEGLLPKGRVKKAVVEGTLTGIEPEADRRAARRQIVVKKTDSSSADAELEVPAILQDDSSHMSDEEFERFDALLSAAPPPEPNWTEASAIDRQSLALGLGAGALLFVLILLFY